MSTLEPPPTTPPPSPEERRRGLVQAMCQAPGLLRYAARYTRSIHDAEDAYQRAMEIALKKAPTVEQRPLIAWLHTVIRNEALAITRGQRREGPSAGDDLAQSLSQRAAEELGPDAVAEWKERYRGVRTAMNALTESQRVCLMLRSAGVSYGEIATMTGFSPRKVERSIAEGRLALQGWEERMARGDECARLLPAMDRVLANEAQRREARAVERHVKSCQGCRAVLARRRRSAEGLASLVPAAILVPGIIPSRPPDPSNALAWWDRVAGSATVRAGTLWQHTLELPAMLGTKAGAGAAVAVAASAAGVPIVADAVRTDTPPPRPPAIVRQVALAPAPPPAPVRVVPPAPTRARASEKAPKKGSAKAATARAARRSPAATPAAPARPAPSPRPRPAPPRATSLEFGP